MGVYVVSVQLDEINALSRIASNINRVIEALGIAGASSAANAAATGSNFFLATVLDRQCVSHWILSRTTIAQQLPTSPGWAKRQLGCNNPVPFPVCVSRRFSIGDQKNCMQSRSAQSSIRSPLVRDFVRVVSRMQTCEIDSAGRGVATMSRRRRTRVADYTPLDTAGRLAA